MSCCCLADVPAESPQSEITLTPDGKFLLSEPLAPTEEAADTRPWKRPRTIRPCCFASLGALTAVFNLAPFPPTMANTTVSATTCTFGASWNAASLPTSMSHTEVRPTMNTLWANPTPIKHATFTPTMSLAQWCTPLCAPSTPCKDASFSTTMCFAEHCVTLGPLGAPGKLATPSTPMRDAKTGLPFCTPSASLHVTSLTPAMSNAKP
ncbi:hypothetical protein Cgig2_016730 [Carnegiea gigantea]|uniref:Uncharacterized protein n=1 Tax=Carnegiea gigantea TaxID=171969 RepID=A0A9Q1KYR1_9CARY|nr:hypothetical protein Cgig2_016730 [Carnegiea gigantea]